jgi:hypothetical protein
MLLLTAAFMFTLFAINLRYTTRLIRIDVYYTDRLSYKVQNIYRIHLGIITTNWAGCVL